MSQPSSLEQSFLTRWDQAARDLDPRPPDPVFQCLFHSERDWIYDYAWPYRLVAIDLNGGGWVRGGHSRELGMANDCAKHNAALLLGWRPFLATTSMISDDPLAVIEPIIELLKEPVLSPNAEYAIWLSLIRNLTKIGASVSHNGIGVTRERRNQFTLNLSGKNYQTEPKPYLIDGQTAALDLILHSGGSSATPVSLQSKPRVTAQVALF